MWQNVKKFKAQQYFFSKTYIDHTYSLNITAMHKNMLAFDCEHFASLVQYQIVGADRAPVPDTPSSDS